MSPPTNSCLNSRGCIEVVVLECNSSVPLSEETAHSSSSGQDCGVICHVGDVGPRWRQGEEVMHRGRTPQGGPPRGIGRTYSEDVEVDTSAGGSSSETSPPSSIEDDPRLFVDVIQANIMAIPDDTVEFLARVTPPPKSALDGTPGSPPRQPPSFLSSPIKGPGLLDRLSNRHNSSVRQLDFLQPQGLRSPSVPQLQLPVRLTRSQTCKEIECDAFAERKKQMTRVSATVDELLGAIVGELI